MHRPKTILPDVWSNRYIAAIPITQADLLVEELNASPDLKCIVVEESLLYGQDWFELVIQTIENKYPYDPYISDQVESLALPNSTAFSSAGLRRRTLIKLFQYLSQEGKLLIYIKNPLEKMDFKEFLHLGYLINENIGIYCHVKSRDEVLQLEPPIIKFHAMKEIINPNSPVYISYSRKDSLTIADIVVEGLEQEGIKVKHDIRDNGPNHSIKEFEKEIGNATQVIVVLSDKYFESHDCMYEMALITKNGNIANRVIFIDNLKDVTRARESHDLIKSKWIDRFDEYRNIDPSDSVFMVQMQEVSMICQYVSDFWKYMKDQVAFRSEDVVNDSANQLSEMLKERLNGNRLPFNDTLIDPLNNSVSPASITNVTQTGRGAVSIGVINGDVHFH